MENKIHSGQILIEALFIFTSLIILMIFLTSKNYKKLEKHIESTELKKIYI